MSDLLSASQAASLLHVSPETLRRWDDEGALPFQAAKTPGGHRRWKRSDIERYARRERLQAIGDTTTITKTETYPLYWEATLVCQTDGEEIWHTLEYKQC